MLLQALVYTVEHTAHLVICKQAIVKHEVTSASSPQTASLSHLP